MKLIKALATIAMSISCVAAQAPEPPGGEAAATIKGGDAYLIQSARVVGDRIASIVRVDRAPGLVAVRADEATRSAEALTRARALLSPDGAAARGRAWHDLGLGSGTEPQDLVVAIERDLAGMTFDAKRVHLLVDPGRLLPEVGQGNPDDDADASVLLTTGVAPDEPVVGHYMAHALLDGPGLEGPVTTDALLARSALAEGSANLAALAFLFGGVGLESEVVSGAVHPEDALGGRLVPDTMRSASPVVASLLQFVYLDGFAQVASLARKGGFGRLAQDRRMRRTTRDVLHLDRPAATPVELLEAPLPSGLALFPADKDSLGEQGIVTLVSILTGKDNLGLIAGDGWVADALWRYEPDPRSTSKPGDGATVWVTQWKTQEEGHDFSYALERCLQARFPGEPLGDDPARGGRVLSRADRIYRIENDGVRIVLRVLPPAIDARMGPPAKKKGPSRPQAPPKK